MPDPWYILSGILIAGAITWTTRAAPFAMLASVRDSKLLAYLGERMPVGIMLILVAYTMRDVDPGAVSSVGPAVLALALTAGLQLWRGDMTLSIVAGTSLYVLLASTVGVA